jgi:hypothetical protein
MELNNIGKKVDEINVTISYRIIELFSAGLYSSPNKAFEELVCNSYDAFAKRVGVYVPSDLSVDSAYIWVCDDGNSMNQEELKDLWKVGHSKKRDDESRNERLQIGRFGIGKLSTYILANNLTYICKKENRYLLTKMDYTRITDNNNDLTLDEIELAEQEAKNLIIPLITKSGKDISPFKLFGKDSEESWTFSLMTRLKTKAAEITEGRLKWVLKTALPLNPNFNLFYNGIKLESSKIKKPLLKKWKIGKDDETAEKIKSVTCHKDEEKHYIDFPNLKVVHGFFELYEDTLLEGKSSDMGRSHGIFLMVRERLVNLDDPLLGMEAFSHGAFNRTRIVVYADQLDDNIASTRESIKESLPYSQLKDYLKKKFNNEVRKYYFEREEKKSLESSLSYRISQTPLTISKAPLLNFLKKFAEGKIINPWLIEKPRWDEDNKVDSLKSIEETLQNENILDNDPRWELMSSYDPIAKFDIQSRLLRINLMHPFIANYIDQMKSKLPIEFIATTEVFTEAYLYEVGLDEDSINAIMKRRDKFLKELVFSDRLSTPLVAQMVKDALSDSTGLEEAIYKALLSLGFEVNKIGGNGKPDGKAEAVLGYSESEKCDNYSLTYDAKSTGKEKIQANTAKLSSIIRHKTDYNADFAFVIAVDYDGSDNPESAISKEAIQQKVTVMRAKDLMRLLLYSAPKQIGLKKLKELFSTCYSPLQVKEWIDAIEKTDVDYGPIKELIEIIYTLQKDDTEPPELASVRLKLNEKVGRNIAKEDIKQMVKSLQTFIPGFLSIEGEKVGVQGTPEIILDKIHNTTNNVPLEMQKLYIDAFELNQ